MKRKESFGPPPVDAIYPEGGEPLYEEEGSGVRLTAADYAARHGFENTKDVEKAYQEAINGRRTAEPDDSTPGTGI